MLSDREREAVEMVELLIEVSEMTPDQAMAFLTDNSPTRFDSTLHLTLYQYAWELYQPGAVVVV